MAVKKTPYLEMPYGEGGDTLFREHYNEAMEIVDGIFYTGESIKYPNVPQTTFDASFFTPNSARFKLRPEMSRYVQLGNAVHFEVAVENTEAITVPADGNIGDRIVGTISSKYIRSRGSYVASINGIAASYGISTNSAKQIEIKLTNFGGMGLRKVVPKGTYFGIAGRFYTTS